MEQKKKQLILQDLCARSPYGVYVLADVYKTFDGGIIGKVSGINIESGLVYLEGVLTPFTIEEIRPYLRSMSSMTEDELKESLEFAWTDDYGRLASYGENIPKYIDWLNKNKFDYRGLIPNNLAIEVTKENNPY